MSYQLRKAAVIGAGTMGAAIAAHCANAGIPVLLLDIVPRELTADEKEKGLTLEDREVRNRIVEKGFQSARKSRPASFFAPNIAEMVTLGNLEDDFQKLTEADWIIEVIVENLEIKQGLMERIDEVRPEHTIVSTNTSGIPVTEIAQGRSRGFKEHFLGTHFFNPPRYLKLLEVIPTEDTREDVIQFITHAAEYRLGKRVVLCKDTPNFIANRLGFGSGAFALDYILNHDYTVKEVDSITGPLIGRPKTATFRLLDLVGIDVWDHVGSNLAQAIPDDELAQPYLTSEPVNDLIQFLVDQGWLGNKTEQGFYKKVVQDGEKDYWPLDLESREYIPPEKTRFESVGKARDIEELGERLTVLLEEEDRGAKFVQVLTYQAFAYASARVPEIADTPKPIDDAMRWGFNHEMGPFETWDAVGVAKVIPEMEERGFPPAPWVKQMLEKGPETFYQYENGSKTAVYHPVQSQYIPLEKDPQLIVLEQVKERPDTVLARNTGATLIDLGDGVGCVEFHTKMNSIDDDILQMMNQAMDRVEAGELNGIVISNDHDRAFSAGANLFGVVMAAQNGMWDQLEAVVKTLQNTNMRMRYFPKPIVVAPHGLTLGGGGEITMHASRVVAAAELYLGQVEIGAGVIPAGGGTKELLRRVVNPPMRVKDALSLPFLQKIFELVGEAKVATSAVEARQYGFLTPDDRIVMNRDHLLAEAKKEVLHMLDSGYAPPYREKIYAGGRDSLAALRTGINMFYEGGYITEYETQIGEKMVYVMCGGELSAPTWVDEQYILDLECEAFLSLCGEEKTQERMWNILRTGKVLRN